MRPRGTWLVTALVVLFLAEGQRAFFASLLALAARASHGPDLLLALLLPLPFLLAPLLPLGKVAQRRTLVVSAATGAAVARLVMMHPGLPVRAITSSLVLTFAMLFIAWIVGSGERRGVAVGLVLGLTVDQLLRLAGSSYDLSIQPVWLPVQALLSLALIGSALAWGRAPGRAAEQGGLERRAAGLRLRSALALGPLLFLDLHVLGLPPVMARWGGIGYGAAAALAALAAALALGVTLGSQGATRGRKAVIGLSALVAIAPLVAWWAGGPGAATLMAAGHGAALLLMVRTMDPASGRRSGAVVSAGAGLFVVFTLLYSAALVELDWLPILQGTGPWVLGAAGLLLLGSATLLPQPTRRTAPFRPAAAGVAGGLAFVAALVIPLATMEPPPAADDGIGGGQTLRLAMLDVAHGFDRGGRFAPEDAAAAIAGAQPHLLVLQNAPAGLPVAYGVDLPLWLGRRVRMSPEPVGGESGLSGGAVLTSALLNPVGDRSGRSGQNDPAAWMARVRVAGVPVGIQTPLATVAASDGADADGPAIVLPLSANPWSPESTQALRARGFRPVGGRSELREVWIRGLRAARVQVPEGGQAHGRLVVVALQPAPGALRSRIEP